MKQEDMLREVKVEDAVGMMLAHDLTQILPGTFKGRLFKKGHVIAEADIPALLSIGKEHIYTLHLADGYVHEDEAALRLAQAVVAGGENVTLTEPHEGKVNVKAAVHGLAKVDRAFVDTANAVDEVVVSTIRTNTVVAAGQSMIGTRVIPLVVEAAKVARIEALAAARRAEMAADATRDDLRQIGLADAERSAEEVWPMALVTVKPFRPLRVGLITTGSEVYKGRITDKFGPVVRAKVAALGSEVVEQRLAPDESEVIEAEIRYFLEERGVDLLLLTGGMSVDPDDRTPGAIKRAGARIVSYGTPMLPGSMLLMGYLGRVPVMGLPGCVMHDPFTSFDVLLPRICAGETIERGDITEMGYGGFLNC